METKREIGLSLLEQCREDWSKDREGHRVADALAIGALNEITLDHTAKGKLPFTFSIDMDVEGITDQGRSNRCWAFAFLNVARYNVIHKLDLRERDFMLSQNYIYFYDQLEKSNVYLNKVIKLIDQPLTHPVLAAALREPISDYGKLSFLNLAKKYGVVPKYIMPDTYCAPDTRPVTKILSMKLRWCTRELKDMRAAGMETAQLLEAKQTMLRGIYGILCRFLGEPPRSFTFEYRDRAGQFHRLLDMTPLRFFNDYCGIPPEEYIETCHMPGDATPFGEWYYRTDFPDEPMPADARPRLNLSIADMKAAAVNQLKGGEMVVFGSDSSTMSARESGAMAADLFHYEQIFGTEMMMRAPDSYTYKWTTANHIMCFDGVNLDSNGNPDRWKVQNSHGDMGIHGHYVMADSWFDQFVASAVIRKKYLPQHVLEWMDRAPRPIR